MKLRRRFSIPPLKKERASRSAFFCFILFQMTSTLFTMIPTINTDKDEHYCVSLSFKQELPRILSGYGTVTRVRQYE